MAAMNFSLADTEDEFTALCGSLWAEERSLPPIVTSFIVVDFEDAFAFLLEQMKLLALSAEIETALTPAVALIS